MRKFFKAATWVLASNILVKLINFFLLNIIARYLSPVQFGFYNAVIASATSLNQISDLGSTMVLQRNTAKAELKGEAETGNRFVAVYLLQFLMNAFLATAILVFPETFSKILFQSNVPLEEVDLIGIVAVMQILFQVPITFILGLSQYRVYALRWLLSSFLSLLITLLTLWIWGPSVTNLLYAWIASAVINIILTIWLTRRTLILHHISLSHRAVHKTIQKVIREGFVYYAGNVLAGALFSFFLISLFSKHIGLDQFGYVRIANAIVAIMSVVPAALQSVSLTYLAKAENDQFAIKSIQLRLVSVMSFLFSVFLICYIKTIVLLLFGKEYVAGWEIFTFILLLNLITILNSLITSFLVSKGFSSYVGWVSTVGVALNALLSFLLIPAIGIYGFFIGQAAGFGFGFIMVLRKEFTEFKYPDIRRLVQLSFIMMIGLLCLLPVILQVEGLWIEIYKITYLLIIAVILYQLSTDSHEKTWFWSMIRSVMVKLKVNSN